MVCIHLSVKTTIGKREREQEKRERKRERGTKILYRKVKVQRPVIKKKDRLVMSLDEKVF